MPATRTTRLSGEKRKATVARFRVANRNLDWFADNYDRIRKQHAGRVVVVWKDRVAATGKTITGAREAAAKNDVPVDQALIEYIPAKGETLVF